MNEASRSRVRRFASRVVVIWHELCHAQRRMIEIRTGVPQAGGPDEPGLHGGLTELDSHLYGYE